MDNPPRPAPAESALALSRRGFLIGAAGTGFTLAFARTALAVRRSGGGGRREALRTHHLVSHRPRGSGHGQCHTRRDGPARRHGRGAHPRRRARGRLELGADRCGGHRPEVGADDHGCQLVGVAELSAIQPAGAAGRIALIEEGARLLGVSRQSCTARLERGAARAPARSLMPRSCGAET